MSESKFQKQVIKEYEAKGYYVIKLVRTNKNGIMDLLALKPKEEPIFIEVKGEKTLQTPLQKYRAEELRKFGFSNVLLIREK